MPPKRQRIEPTASFRGHAFQALQSSSAARERADDYEWLGDAVIGEFVARCLLSHFEHVPLSARVFRHLCLGVVANGNLAKVYDAMDYATSVRRQIPVVARAVTRKRRANRVEAMVGELVLQVHVETRHRAKYRAHLDAIVSTMLRTHFRDRILERAETTKRTLSVACNWFMCLPEEHLDETTGELIVSDGEFTWPRVEQEEGRRSWDDPDAAEATSRTTRWPCHALGTTALRASVFVVSFVIDS
ncbi:hypothetical protein PsorP6_015024 [Peronosclerospora sorghi]|uniref:Uncharacterized protein n=1 Tax=Peronosclerospora sorghi TaxID=230839 RepID=A0ACC0VSB1_9STRA|nr:hypothetical protein PsorP6_015024 [Peronosclerospora sorghi]